MNLDELVVVDTHHIVEILDLNESADVVVAVVNNIVVEQVVAFFVLLAVVFEVVVDVTVVDIVLEIWMYIYIKIVHLISLSSVLLRNVDVRNRFRI
jgi:antitoxin component of MazEF toxin-antitoxin module